MELFSWVLKGFFSFFRRKRWGKCLVICAQFHALKVFWIKIFLLRLKLKKLCLSTHSLFRLKWKISIDKATLVYRKLKKTGGLEKLITEISLPRIIFNAKFLNGKPSSPCWPFCSHMKDVALCLWKKHFSNKKTASFSPRTSTAT